MALTGRKIARALQLLRDRAGLSLEETARRMGFSRASSIQRYFSPEDFRGNFLSPEIAQKIVKALSGRGDPPIQDHEILSLVGIPSSRAVSGASVPMIDFIQAGAFGLVTDPYQAGGADTVPVSRGHGPHAFALTVSGRSMEPLYAHGDVIVIDPDIAPRAGDDVVAKLELEEEATFKRYSPKPRGEVELEPLNKTFPVLKLTAKNPGRIVGVMMEHHRYRKGK